MIIPFGFFKKEVVGGGGEAYYDLDGDASLNFTTDYIILGLVNQSWVIRASLEFPNAFSCLVGEKDSSSAFFFRIRDNGQAFGQLNGPGGLSTATSASSSASVAGDIHVYTMTYNGSNLILYEDNTVLINASDPDFTGFSSGDALEIGVRATADEATGKFYQVQAYNKALSTGEIASLVTDITNTATGLVLDFAGDKASGAWTDEVGAAVATVGTGVTLVTP